MEVRGGRLVSSIRVEGCQRVRTGRTVREVIAHAAERELFFFFFTLLNP